jgi:hypothetical protein
MKIVVQIEHRASSSRGKHEGESSFGLCDRLSRTRDNSQRQLPTDQDYAVSTREYQTDQSSLKTAPTAARSVLGKRRRQRQQQTHRSSRLTRSLHIRPSPSSAPSATQPPAASPRTAANTPPSESQSSPTATFRPFTTTSWHSASRVISPSRSRRAPASSWSSRRNLSPTTSPLSHSSPQPSCDRFVRLASYPNRGGCEARPGQYHSTME